MISISVLGEQAIVGERGVAIPARSSHSLALVAFLAAHAGIPQDRERLATAFWPDSTGAQALTNLRRELHLLRRLVASDPALTITARQLCWHDTRTCRVDLCRFEDEYQAARRQLAAGDDAGALVHAAAALEAYGGEFLPTRGENWVLDLRAELEERCVRVCELACTVATQRADLPTALAAARRRVGIRPLDEAGHRILIRLLADSGDRAGAISAYHRCASILDRELGIGPDHTTRQSLQRVLASGTTDIAPAAVVDAQPSRSGTASAPLIGRAEPLRALLAARADAARGRPTVVVVRGDAGVGKTRLVAEVARRARLEGAIVASSQCFGTAGQLALAPVADWLRNPAIRAATNRLPPIWQAEVHRLLPPVAAADRATAASRAVVDAWQRHRFFEGLAHALLGTGRPVVLRLENLQWCDQESLSFLAFLVRFARTAPLTLAMTLRDDGREQSPHPERLLAGLRASGTLLELRLGPLEHAETGQLTEAICGRTLGQPEIAAIQALTGGFPLYVVEAARTVVDSGHAWQLGCDLLAVLRTRLDQVGSVAREVAGLAAAAGRDFGLDLLTEASDLDADAVVQAVDELWRRRIIREAGDGYDFSHDLLRDTAYSQITPARRWLLHRRIAQGLELIHAGDPDAVCGQLAGQYARGGRPDRAVAYYRRAAEIAAARFGHAEAIRLNREALALVRARPRTTGRDVSELEILEAVAAPLNAKNGYSCPELQAVLRRSVALAGGLGRKDSLITAVSSLWASEFVSGDLAAARRTANRAVELVDPRSAHSAAAHFALAGSLVSMGEPLEALRQFEISSKVSTGAPWLSVGTRPDIHGTAWAAHAHWLVGDADAALASAEHAVELARTIEHPYTLAVVLAYAAVTHQLRGDTDRLATSVAQLRELCARYGFAYYREWGLVLDGWLHEDIASARRGIDGLRAQGAFTRMPYWLSLVADLQARAGDIGAARAVLDAAHVDALTRQDVWWLPEITRLRASLANDSRTHRRLASSRSRFS